jgi:multidrug resistance protein MdtO
MAQTADGPWRATVRQTWIDLQPFPGRLGLTWRIALLCALVAATAMLLKIPESAISCYLIIFLMRPDSAAVSGQALGLIVLASIVVVAMAPIIQFTADSPMLRIAVIAGASFIFLYLGSASQLGETGSIIGLVIAFVLTLVDDVPANGIITHGLFYAWKMAAMPMMLMILFNLVLGTGPHHLARETIAERLRAAAELLERPTAEASRRLSELLAAGNAEIGQQVLLTRLFHTASSAMSCWLSGAVTSSYRLMLAVQALPRQVSDEMRVVLARRCQEAAERISGCRKPEAADLPAERDDEPVTIGTIRTALKGLAQDNGGTDAPPPKAPFFADDALTNPDHQRYALKTTAAAVLCYIIYSLWDWQGIHTAMITCYVAALGTTGETVHKLVLRISGCLVGAALGIGAILFVIPHLTSVGGLMVLVFCGVFVGAWVSTGNERISYGGVQIGLAFLLTILNGFAPSLDMDSARDRIMGILLGNVVVYLIFTGIWSKTTLDDVQERLAKSFRRLAAMAALPREQRLQALLPVEQIEVDMGHAREEMALTMFEPRNQRPPAARLASARAMVAETRSLASLLLFSPVIPDEARARLEALSEALAARRLSDKGAGMPLSEPLLQEPGPDPIDHHLRRIEHLAGQGTP